MSYRRYQIVTERSENQVYMFNGYNVDAFGDRLKKIREDRMKEFERKNKEPAGPIKRGKRSNRFSQEKLAEEISITRGSVLAWEKGDRIPPVETMVRLCELLDCDLDYLLGRCDTFRKETADISEATGLSPAAAETLIKWKSFSDGEVNPTTITFDEFAQTKFGQKTLNSLLESDEGMDVLSKIGLYLHGKISRTLPRGEREQMEHDLFKHLSNTNASKEEIGAEFQALEDELDREKKTVNFIIEDLDMSWGMDTEYVKSMILSWVQEALTNLKKKMDAAKGKEGGSADGNGEEARR